MNKIKDVKIIDNPKIIDPLVIWRDMDNFSSVSVCSLLASDYFDEEDYFRDYNEFKKFKIL